MPVVGKREPWELVDENTNKLAVAKSIVSHSILVRKSEESLNPTSMVYLLLIVGIFALLFWRIQVHAEASNKRQATVATALASGGNAYDIGGLANIRVPDTATPIPTHTLMPTITPTMTMTPAPVTPELLLFKLSFYDPDIAHWFKGTASYVELAEVNCAVYDFTNDRCVSHMSNGDDFRLWYGKGVACPPGYVLGDIIRVIYPTQLAGDWVCVDRGGAIVDGYLDFLLMYPDMIWTGYNLNDFPWSSTVQAYHIHP